MRFRAAIPIDQSLAVEGESIYDWLAVTSCPFALAIAAIPATPCVQAAILCEEPPAHGVGRYTNDGQDQGSAGDQSQRTRFATRKVLQHDTQRASGRSVLRPDPVAAVVLKRLLDEVLLTLQFELAERAFVRCEQSVRLRDSCAWDRSCDPAHSATPHERADLEGTQASLGISQRVDAHVDG